MPRSKGAWPTPLPQPGQALGWEAMEGYKPVCGRGLPPGEGEGPHTWPSCFLSLASPTQSQKGPVLWGDGAPPPGSCFSQSLSSSHQLSSWDRAWPGPPHARYSVKCQSPHAAAFACQVPSGPLPSHFVWTLLV